MRSHENSSEHKTNIVNFKILQRGIGRIDAELAKQVDNEILYWKKVLIRIIKISKFLSSRGLAFRGTNQHIGMKDNGNFLGAVELLTQFDPFIASHVEQFADLGKGIPSYLSKTIYEEVIIKIHKSLTNVILAELKKGKYYSIIVDSTPDISHVDQLVFAVQYVCPNCEPVERF